MGSFGNWTAPDAAGWILFAVCGFFGGLAFIFINAAYRRAQAAIIVPFEYTGLIWAAAAGYLFWGEVPGANTWSGAAIIIASGLFILFRETAVRRRPQPQLDFPMQEVACVDAGGRLSAVGSRRVARRYPHSAQYRVESRIRNPGWRFPLHRMD